MTNTTDAARENARTSTGLFGEQTHSAPSTEVVAALSDADRKFDVDVHAMAVGGATWDSIEPFDGDDVRHERGVALVTEKGVPLCVTGVGGGYPTVHLANPFYEGDYNLTVYVEDANFEEAVTEAEWAAVANDAAYKSGNLDDANDRFSINEVIAPRAEPLRSELFVRDYTNEDHEGYIVQFDHASGATRVLNHNYQPVEQPGLLEIIEAKTTPVSGLKAMFAQNLADITARLR